MAGRVHFASLVCVDYDMDLFEHWTTYYQLFDYDSYYLFLHTNNHDMGIVEKASIMDRVTGAGFNCSFVEGRFNNGELRDRHLGAYHRCFLDEGDYLVTADSDEFHEVKDIPGFKDVIRSHDAVEGYLVDCWGERLVDALPDKPLREQYPHEGVFLEAGGIQGTIHPNRRKIIAARKEFSVNYIGSHCIFNPHNIENMVVYKHPPRLRVLHYTYRKSMPWRMFGKGYFRSRDIYKILVYFGEDAMNHPALKAKIAEEDKMMDAQGWIPARSRTLTHAESE